MKKVTHKNVKDYVNGHGMPIKTPQGLNKTISKHTKVFGICFNSFGPNNCTWVSFCLSDLVGNRFWKGLE